MDSMFPELSTYSMLEIGPTNWLVPVKNSRRPKKKNFFKFSGLFLQKCRKKF